MGLPINNPYVYNFISIKGFKVVAPSGPTYWTSSSSKIPNILDIFVSKISNNLYCTTKNILDLNSDHSSVLLALNITSTKKETPQLFNKFTNHHTFHDLSKCRNSIKC